MLPLRVSRAQIGLKAAHNGPASGRGDLAGAVQGDSRSEKGLPSHGENVRLADHPKEANVTQACAWCQKPPLPTQFTSCRDKGCMGLTETGGGTRTPWHVGAHNASGGGGVISSG